MLKKKILIEAFTTLNVYKKILDLDGLKCELKWFYAADFTKQASNIREFTELI